MATLTSPRSGWFSAKLAGRGFSKETASPLWAITAWIVGLIAFFPVLYMFLTGFKIRARRGRTSARSSSSGRRSRIIKRYSASTFSRSSGIRS